MTSSPASRSFFAVPPVDNRCTFLEARNLQKSTIPVLSETEMRARVVGTTSCCDPLIEWVVRGIGSENLALEK